MSIFAPFIKAFTWLSKVFVSHAESAAQIAVVITEAVKSFLASPTANLLESVADTVTGTNLPTAAANAVSSLIPKILAVELGVEGLPENPTADQILAFEKDVLEAFNVSTNNSKLYTELAAQTYGEIQATINNGDANFADWVNAVEAVYKDYQNDVAANSSTSSTTTASSATNQTTAKTAAIQPAAQNTQATNGAQPEAASNSSTQDFKAAGPFEHSSSESQA